MFKSRCEPGTTAASAASTALLTIWWQKLTGVLESIEHVQCIIYTCACTLQVTIFFCRGCGRYLQPPRHWVRAELESRELLTFCIKRIRGLGKVTSASTSSQADGLVNTCFLLTASPDGCAIVSRKTGDLSVLYYSCNVNVLLQLKLVDAGFIWTEPHSKRLKVKLTVQVCMAC